MLYGLGAGAAVWNGIKINWAAYLLGQVVVTSTQLMGQYINEYYDMEVDRLTAGNRTWFSGGSGVLSLGGISPNVVLTAARTCAVVAILTGILASLQSIWMIPIITLSLLGSWFYSSPPLSLMSSGWGELKTSVIVAMLVPLAGYCMQGSYPPFELWLVSLPLVLIHMAMLISFEFPDYDADLSVGKKTLTVRLGLHGAALVVTTLISFGILFICLPGLFSKYPGRWMEWAIPLAIWQMIMIHLANHTPTRSRYYLLTTSGIALFVIMAFLALLGFVFSVY